jgi:predicted ATPase
MRIAERIHSLAQQQNDPALKLGAYRALAGAHYFLGDFVLARRYAMCGIQIWRSGGVPSQVEQVTAPAVACLYYEALSEWQFGEIASSKVTMTDAISLAKELNDMHGLAVSLYFAGFLGQIERNVAEVERCAANMVELCMVQNFALWRAGGEVLRGWARSASGHTGEGISWILDGIDDWRATGFKLLMPYLLALKAEALYLAGRTSEALEAINEAEAVAEEREERWWCGELHRLRAVFLAAMGADETQIEASFDEAIRIAKQQKSISLEKRAEGTYTEYCRQKASASRGRGFRLSLW